MLKIRPPKNNARTTNEACRVYLDVMFMPGGSDLLTLHQGRNQGQYANEQSTSDARFDAIQFVLPGSAGFPYCLSQVRHNSFSGSAGRA